MAHGESAAGAGGRGRDDRLRPVGPAVGRPQSIAAERAREALARANEVRVERARRAGEVVDPVTLPAVVGVSIWNVANALTLLRIVLVPVFGWLLLYSDGRATSWRFAAAACFVVAVVTDRFDGELARRRGLITDVGKIADPIADKALMGAALVGLSLLGELPWWVTVVVLLREVGITLMRFFVIRHGVMPAGRGGKAKTALQALAVTLYVLPLPTWMHPVELVLMTAAVALTLVTGADYVAKAATLVASSDRTARRRAARAVPRPGA
ncbi:MAG: CDP-diacylglycerol--glycerol-3-phosphate 3-phosphatidyltransferase [Kineosporiaceae bacterium]